VLEVLSPTQVRAIMSSPDLARIAALSQPGDTVRLLRYGSFNPIAETSLASISYAGKLTDDLPEAIANRLGKPRQRQRTHVVATLTFAQPPAAPLAVGDYLVLRRFFPSHYAIHDSAFHDTRARGLLLMGPDGVVERNTIDTTYLAGIQLGPEFPGGSADWVRHLLIRGNTLTNTCFSDLTGPGSDEVGAIHLGGGRRVAHLPWGQGNRDVQILDNTIAGTGMAGIFVNGLIGGTIRGNRINRCNLASGADAGSKVGLTAPYAVTLMNSTDVVVDGNTLAQPGPHCEGPTGDLGTFPKPDVDAAGK